MFSALMGLGTWAYLRVAVDVVDGIDGIFTRPVTGDRLRKSASLGTHPVWWREARLKAWGSSAAPILVTWGLVLLAIFQTGTWLAPGVLLAIGIGNTAAVLVLTAWLASRTIADERRRGTLEVLLVTTISTPSVAFGKAAGAALPTVPLMLIGMPMVAFGYVYLDFFVASGEAPLLEGFGTGLSMWAWAVPVWACVNVAAMTLAARLRQPRSAFGLTLVGLVAIVGWTPLVGRMFPDLPVLAQLARVVAPPLAGWFSDGELLGSMALWTAAAGVGFVTLSRRLRSWIGGGAAASILLALVASTPAQAQPSPTEIAALERAFGIRMAATPLADGLSREERWTQARVLVENRGSAVEGQLTWTEPTGAGARRITRPLSIPEGGRKVVDLPILRGPSPQPRAIWFEGGARQAAAVLKFVSLAPEDVGIGAIGTDPLGLPAAVPDAWSGAVPRRAWVEAGDADLVRSVRTGVMPVATLPSFAAGYDALDQIVWPAADPSRLSADQLRALLDWVADGGHLLVTVTDTWRAVAGSPLGEALPVMMAGVTETDLRPLAALLGTPGVGAEVDWLAPTVRADLRTDRQALGRGFSNEGRPLWALGRFGLGSIQVVLADLSIEPLARVDRRTMWRRLLHLPAPGSAEPELGSVAEHQPLLREALHLVPERPELDDAAVPPTFVEQGIRNRLSTIPNLAPLPIELLAAFSVLYLLWIGPVDYLVLRWLGRQTWTWVTFPAVIVVFSTIALVAAAQHKGSQARLVSVERIDVLPDAGRLRGDAWLGLFSTRKAALTVASARRDAVVRPLGQPGFMSEPRYRTDGGPVDLVYDAETWTLGYSHSRWTDAADGRIEATWAADRIILTNALPFDFELAALVDPEGRAVALGPLPRGETRTLDDPEGGQTLEPDLGWAVATNFDRVVERGASQSRGHWAFVGVLRQAVDPIRIDGLAPRVTPFTVVRQVLPDRASPRSRPVFTATLEPAEAAAWARLVCRDQTSVVRVRGGQARIPLPRGVAVDAEGCRLEVAPPLSGWFSGVEVSIGGPNRCTVTDREVRCESTR